MENVLIINSNLMQSKRLDIILTLEGYYCIAVIDGSEAINLLLKRRFEIIFFNENTDNISLTDLKKSFKTLNLSLPIFVIKQDYQEQDLIKDPDYNIYYMDHRLISERLPEKIKEVVKH